MTGKPGGIERTAENVREGKTNYLETPDWGALNPEKNGTWILASVLRKGRTRLGEVEKRFVEGATL